MLSTKNYNFIKLVVKEPLVRMIPKIIHYAWIGTEMPQRVKERVKMWKKELPDWKFMFWNETNYDFKKFEFKKVLYIIYDLFYFYHNRNYTCICR